MGWHAVDAVDDAIAATRRFLFPFSLVRWTVLAVLVLLMSAPVSTNVSVPFVPDVEFTTFTGEVSPGAAVPELGTATIIALGGAVAVLGVVVTVVRLSLRLVFYDALRTNEVRVRGRFIKRLPQAFGLFVFSLVVSLVVVFPLLVAVGASTTVGSGPIDAIGDSLVGVVALIPGWGIGVMLLFGALLGTLVVLIARFTYEFVVPVMVHRNDGVVSAWRRFSATLRKSWTEFLVYLLVRFVLGVGTSIAETVVFLFAGGAVLVLGGLALLIVAGLLGGVSTLTGTTAGVVATLLVLLIAIGALLIVFLPVRLVTRTYLITYEVSMLGGVDPELAMLDPAIDPTDTASAERDESGQDGGPSKPVEEP